MVCGVQEFTVSPFLTGLNAASLAAAQSYIEAFQKLSEKSNTLILPSNVADVSGVVGSAVTMYRTLANNFQESGKMDQKLKNSSHTTPEDKEIRS